METVCRLWYILNIWFEKDCGCHGVTTLSVADWLPRGLVGVRSADEASLSKLTSRILKYHPPSWKMELKPHLKPCSLYAANDSVPLKGLHIWTSSYAGHQIKPANGKIGPRVSGLRKNPESTESAESQTINRGLGVSPDTTFTSSERCRDAANIYCLFPPSCPKRPLLRRSFISSVTSKKSSFFF